MISVSSSLNEFFSTAYSLLLFLVLPFFVIGIIWNVAFHSLKEYQEKKVDKRIRKLVTIKFLFFLITNAIIYFELIDLGAERNNYFFYLYIMTASIIILVIDIYIISKKPSVHKV